MRNHLFRRIFSYLLPVFLLSGMVFAASGNLNLNVLTEKIDPSVVEPGSDFTVTLKLLNNGEKLIEDVSITPKVEGPITLKSSEATDLEKAICIGCSKQATYYFQVKESALSGSYPVVFQINAGNQLSIKHIATIKVTGKPDIIFFYDSASSSIKPRQSFSAPLKFKNIGTGRAKNIRITSTTENFVLAGSNTFYMESLQPNEEKLVALDFYVGENVNPNSYFIPLSISYQDDLLNSYISTQDLGVKVNNVAELNLQRLKIEPSILEKGKEALVYIVVENAGKGEAKNTEVTLNFDKIEQKSYLGKIKSGEDEQSAFTFVPESSGSRELVFTISYTDDDGDHSLVEKVPVAIKGTGFLPILLWLIGIAVVISAILFFMKKKG